MRHRCEHNLPLTTEEREQWLKIIPRRPFECGRPLGIKLWGRWYCPDHYDHVTTNGAWK